MNYRMNNIKFHVSNELHFKQWSHKGYAAFCSIGKVVHIGNLAVSVTQWIGNLIEHVENIITLSVDQEEDESAEDLLDQELLQVIPVIVNNFKESGIIVIGKNINCR